MLCVSLLALVAFGHSSKADTVTSTVISETSEVISEETTVENQGAGVELHTTTTVTETTTISNQKTVGDEKTTGQYLTNRGFQTGNTNGWTVNQGTVQICATCGPFGGRAQHSLKLRDRLSPQQALFSSLQTCEAIFVLDVYVIPFVQVKESHAVINIAPVDE